MNKNECQIIFTGKLQLRKKKGKIVHHHTLKLLKMSKDQHLSFDLVLRSSKCQNLEILLSSLYVGV